MASGSHRRTGTCPSRSKHRRHRRERRGLRASLALARGRTCAGRAGCPTYKRGNQSFRRGLNGTQRRDWNQFCTLGRRSEKRSSFFGPVSKEQREANDITRRSPMRTITDHMRFTILVLMRLCLPLSIVRSSYHFGALYPEILKEYVYCHANRSATVIPNLPRDLMVS